MKSLVLSIICIFGFSSSSLVADQEKLPAEITHQSGDGFKLCKQQLITKALFFDIVDVGIYYKDCPKKINVFDDSEKLLRFHYLRKVTGKQFKEGAEEYLKYNLTNKQHKLCFRQYLDINNAYVDVNDGDFYDLFKIKEKGLDLYLNGKPLSQFKNDDCESLYFKIWFGEKSMSSDFKKLLSQ